MQAAASAAFGFTASAASGALTSTRKCVSFRKSEEKITLGAVGVGGMGLWDVQNLLKTGRVRIGAFCDVNRNAFNKLLDWCKENNYPTDAPCFTDYRKMLETVKDLDAVSVAVPDHSHAAPAILAMQRGCHVYVEKPLVRTMWEARYFEHTAKEYGVVTQMGNWGCTQYALRRGVELLQSGILGEVREIHNWTNRPLSYWIQPVSAPQGEDPVPEGIDWNCWIGTAPWRPFKRSHKNAAGKEHPYYLGGHWRPYHDFGLGSLGDQICHVMNLPMRGLGLGAVTGAQTVEVSDRTPGSFPGKVKLNLDFAARGAMPPVRLTWYEGGYLPSADLMPQAIAGLGNFLEPGKSSGCLILGSKGIWLSTGDYGMENYLALNGEKKIQSVWKHPACLAVPSKVAEYKKIDHWQEFVAACHGERKTSSGIDHSIPLVEAAVIASLAERLPGEKIAWDQEKCRSDSKAANALLEQPIRKGWEYGTFKI